MRYMLILFITASLGLLFVNESQGQGFDVSWDLNTEADLAGYNVYKTVPGPPVRVVVTAFDLAGNESGPSNTVAWADLDGDGDCDGKDLALFCTSFGTMLVGPPL